MNTKKLLIIICLLANQFLSTVNAQAPQSFNYQAVARDAAGTVLSNQAVSFRISLLQGSATGTNVYSETHAVTTNLFGLVNFAIGGGTIVSGSFANINWAQGPYFAQIELDATGGSTYVIMNTTQLLSVPYAQYAEKSGNPTLQAGSGITIQNDSIINTAQNQQINLSATGQTNITGTYPNYVVNTPNIQSGNGISVTGQTITNTAPDQTVTINGTGQTNVTGTYPNFTVNTPPYTAGTGINISGTNISAQNTNAIWNANKLQGKAIDTLSPTLGNVLEYDGTKWKPSPKLPQMTTAQREALTNVYTGMTILNSITNCIEYYDGSNWRALCGTLSEVGTSENGGYQQGSTSNVITTASFNGAGSLWFTIGNSAYFNIDYNSNPSFWEYNFTSNLWIQRPNPSSFNGIIRFSINGKGYIFDSPNDICNTLRFDPVLNQWTNLGQPGNIPTGCKYIGSNSSIVYFGTAGSLGGIFEFNPLTNSFTPSPIATNQISLGLPLYPSYQSCIDNNGKYYYMCGQPFTNTLAIFNPSDSSIATLNYLELCNSVVFDEHVKAIYNVSSSNSLPSSFVSYISLDNSLTPINSNVNWIDFDWNYTPFKINNQFYFYDGGGSTKPVRIKKVFFN
jgi:hypothetical protein